MVLNSAEGILVPLEERWRERYRPRERDREKKRGESEGYGI